MLKGTVTSLMRISTSWRLVLADSLRRATSMSVGCWLKLPKHWRRPPSWEWHYTTAAC